MNCWRLICLLFLFVGLGCMNGESKKEDLTTPDASDAAPDESTDPAPDVYKVKLETTKGDVIIEVKRHWAPHGADRFYKLVTIGFYDGCKFFRVVDGFMAQVGMNGDPKVHAQWGDNNIPDDKPVMPNTRGYVSFAQTSSLHSRSTQFFINYGTNKSLDRPQRGGGAPFAPFGKVIEGMEVADQFFSGYGGNMPQLMIQREGNKFLEANYPKLDAIKKATVIEESE